MKHETITTLIDTGGVLTTAITAKNPQIRVISQNVVAPGELGTFGNIAAPGKLGILWSINTLLSETGGASDFSGSDEYHHRIRVYDGTGTLYDGTGDSGIGYFKIGWGSVGFDSNGRHKNGAWPAKYHFRYRNGLSVVLDKYLNGGRMVIAVVWSPLTV